MSDAARDTAEAVLGPRIACEWSRDLNGCRITLWRETDYMPPARVVTAEAGENPYVVTRDLQAFERFIKDSRIDLSDVAQAIDLIKHTLPGTRHVLRNDSEGMTRDIFGDSWCDPSFSDSELVFYCNHAERAMIEKWSISEARALVEDVAPGRGDLLL